MAAKAPERPAGMGSELRRIEALRLYCGFMPHGITDYRSVINVDDWNYGWSHWFALHTCSAVSVSTMAWMMGWELYKRDGSSLISYQLKCETGLDFWSFITASVRIDFSKISPSWVKKTSQVCLAY
jgi:hypothetical protein